jgi:hypothetical protein
MNKGLDCINKCGFFTARLGTSAVAAAAILATFASTGCVPSAQATEGGATLHNEASHDVVLASQQPDAQQEVTDDKLPYGDPQDALQKAVELTQKGRYEEALQIHLWFHENALRIEPALVGVRASFALSYWVELGKKYPKAMDALREIRDKGLKELEGSSDDSRLLMDVVSINRYLDEPKVTVELLKKLHSERPQFAASVGSFIQDVLVEEGEYKLARKFMRDPVKALESAKARRTLYNDYLGEDRTDLRQIHDDMFAREVAPIIKILANTGDIDLARKIQREALKVVDHEEIRKAMHPW